MRKWSRGMAHTLNPGSRSGYEVIGAQRFASSSLGEGSNGVGEFRTGELNRVLRIWWASQVAQWWKNLPAIRRHGFNPWVGKIPWRRKWQPTPIFLPGKSLVGYSQWGRKDLDTTERLNNNNSKNIQFLSSTPFDHKGSWIQGRVFSRAVT